MDFNVRKKCTESIAADVRFTPNDDPEICQHNFDPEESEELCANLVT